MKNLLIFFLLPYAVYSQSMSPVNPDASNEAKALLNYLYEINGEKILSGQHCYNHEPDRYFDKVNEMTGGYPAVWGTDFIWNGLEDNGQNIVDAAIKKHKEGSIVTLMFHSERPIDTPPFRWKENIQGELTDAQWKEMTTPGTQLNLNWQKQVDRVAEYLKQLRDANVPVLWRPYHEMNGVWFWWGDKKGEDGYQKLWKMMYDRYTNHHKLNNLVWVWNANAPRDIPFDQGYSYKDFYPGHAYVDVLATDVYHFDYEQKDYDELLALAEGKLIALGEVGQLPKAEILKVQPKWAWFMVWSGWLTTHNTEDRVKEVYEYEKTLTREEVKLEY